ncbi:kinase-like domain-containing protein [Xylaria nigripes]|nr:kinase-like domain-containing protein [Xylaria nigripes]
MAAELASFQFDAHMRSLGWAFDDYRRFARLPRPPGNEFFRQNRAQWRDRVLPFPGRPNPRHDRPVPYQRIRLTRNMAWPDLDSPIPLNHSPKFTNARSKLREVKDYFERPWWSYRRALGFGGNGLAVKYRYIRPEQVPIDFVVKVSVRNWKSKTIREEEKMTRKMYRAAHAIQLIDRRRVGLPPQRRWRFDMPPDDDTSEEESSGDESRADEPDARRRDKRTRRERIMELNSRMIKMRNYVNRRAAQEVLRNRRRALKAAERRRPRKRPVPPQPPDTHDIYRRDFMLIEFCEYGDLENLLFRLNEQNKNVPNRVLWGFWLCLVRACVGMQYPVRKFHPRRRNPTPEHVNAHPGVDINEVGKMVGNDLYEDIPGPRRRWARKRFVHFDIDPKNILITYLDVNARDEEHKHVPRLKLADFGLAEEIKPYKINFYYLARRRVGKFGYYAPEQFGADWDYVRRPDGGNILTYGSELSEQPIAGNYGSHTNVWGIALVLWQLITKLEIPVPPQLQHGDQSMDIPDHYCALLLTDPTYQWVDLELRETIARCLAYDPRQRPRLTTLLPAARRGIGKVFEGETDTFVRDWVQDMILNP